MSGEQYSYIQMNDHICVNCVRERESVRGEREGEREGGWEGEGSEAGKE